MSQQQALTIIAPVILSRMDELRFQLSKLKNELIRDVHEAFEDLGTIHFARWIIIEAAEVQGERLSPKLVFSSNFDGTIDEHIQALANRAGEIMDRSFQYCQEYPTGNPSGRVDYLKKHSVGNVGFFVGAPGRSLDQIRKEHALQAYIRNVLNEKNWNGTKPVELQKHVRQKVLENPKFSWVKEKVSIPGKSYFGLFLMGIALLVLLPFILIWLLIIQIFYESKDVPLGLTPSQVSEPHLRKLEEYEDLENQNQFTQVLIMKPGAARLFTFKGFMLFSRHLIKNLFVNGKLMGIPTIHFARWLLMDNNKRMLFLSNFDGSWQQYLGDFIDKSGWGLTAIWSNSMGFPKTKFTFFGGAYDEEHFLAWSRYYEVPTQVWYTAYPHLSIKNVINNTYIRMELMEDLDEKGAKKFFKRF